MTEPSQKHPAMEEFLEELFGRTTAIHRNICALCLEPAVSFRDILSQKEYSISGMCQSCQDDCFGGHNK